MDETETRGVADPGGVAGLRPLISYFLMAYAITWGGILLYLWTLGFAFDRVGTPEALVIFGLMLTGPSIAGLSLTTAFGGRDALGELYRRIVHVRVPVPWYALALLTTPLLLLAVLLPLASWVSPDFAPSFLAFGVVAGLLAGTIEELGWTGFATPHLLARTSPLRAGLILGLAWAAWHGLADYAGNAATMGTSDWLIRLIVYWIIPLTGYRVLMTWAYSHHRSLGLNVLMHASYTGWLAALTMEMPAATGPNALVWQIPFAVAICLVVAVVALRSRQPRHRPAIAAARA
jgi:membrane protease YdiL (CAAX protease family)